jgi:hypothetical protein
MRINYVLKDNKLATNCPHGFKSKVTKHILGDDKIKVGSVRCIGCFHCDQFGDGWIICLKEKGGDNDSANH